MSLPARAHILGIGGVGMSGVALLLRANGITVTGSDLRESPLLERVREAGCTVSLAPDPVSVGQASWLVVPDSVSDEHPEVVEATRLQLLVCSRDEALSLLLSGTETRVLCGALNRGATLHAIVAALQSDAVGYFSGAIPTDGRPHARLGDPMFVELDERFVSDLAGKRCVLATDLPANGLGYYTEPAPAEHLRALAAHSQTHLILPEPDDAGFAFVSSRAGARFRLTFDDAHRQLQLETSKSSTTCTLPQPSNPFQLRTLAAAGAYLHLEERWDGARLAEGLSRASSASIVGQFEVRTRGPRRFIHDVRTHPVGVAALIEAARAGAESLQVVVRPYPFTLRAYDDVHWASAFSMAGHVQLLPAYPGGDGTDEERLSRILVSRGIDVTRTSAYQDQGFQTTLFVGGEDMGALAEDAATSDVT